jgi:nitroreductase
MFDKKADTQVEIHGLLARRWSGRAYDPDRPVERDKLLALLEAARWSPSCFGDQPWRFLVWDRCADPHAWQRAFDCLAEGNRTWAFRAPLLLLACADSQLRDGRPNRWGPYDTGAASMSLSVEATALGLMVHQMGGFDVQKMRTEFAIPPQFDGMAMITVGYQLPENRVPDDLLEREHAPRSRRPLADNFYAGEWGVGITG